MRQTIIDGLNSSVQLEEVLSSVGVKKHLLVCGSSLRFLPIKNNIAELNRPYASFSGFTPNPLYEDICKGVELFNASACDAIVAVGGGSAIDVAKCIKLFCRMDKSTTYLSQEYADSGIPLIAVPTTAGSGSESTKHAVIYYKGKKQSIAHNSIMPDYAILDASVLETLPLYQKKCTMLDALCQGVESWWSVNSTDESRLYSKTAVELIMENYKDYLSANTRQAGERIMTAANYAGRAINITQTTAAHAMSYMITSMYKLPHGHAVAVCLPDVCGYMVENLDECTDSRGVSYLKNTLADISHALGSDCLQGASRLFKELLIELDIQYPIMQTKDDISTLVSAVNPERLKNNPVRLSSIALTQLYQRIVK